MYTYMCMYIYIYIYYFLPLLRDLPTYKMTSLPPSKFIVPPSKLIVTIFDSEGFFYEGGNRASV